jgi:hypothetical protein
MIKALRPLVQMGLAIASQIHAGSAVKVEEGSKIRIPATCLSRFSSISQEQGVSSGQGGQQEIQNT